MSRPTDWHVLDLDHDPTPGEPGTVRRMARAWDQLADDAEYAETQLRRLVGDEAVGKWVGEAGDAFREKTNDLPDQLRKCKESYRLASDALTWWAGRLSLHQADADRALAQGRVARGDLEDARRRAAAAAASYESAAGAGVLTDRSLEPTPEQVRDARQRLSSAQAAASSADAAVAAAEQRLDAIRQMALEAEALRKRDAHTAAERIHEASDAGIPERSRWDKLKDWAGEAWDVIVTVAKVVVAVLGVIALIIGGPLAWVVFAAALVLLADAIMNYMNGQGSLWDLAWAALGCIPGTKGLTSLAALRNAFRTGGMLAAGAHVLGAGRDAVVALAAGIRALGPGLRNTVVYVRAVAKGLQAMRADDAFGVLGTLRRIPDVLRIPPPRVGQDVYRVFGPALDVEGLPMINPTSGFPMGSRPGGASWTPIDPRLADDFRVQAGLPDENPASYFVEGTLVDPSQVQEIRLALPLDGNPGGWPEYILWNSNIGQGPGSVAPTHIGGVNEPWTTAPGAWAGPASGG